MVLCGTLVDVKTTRIHLSYDPQFSPPPLSDPPICLPKGFWVKIPKSAALRACIQENKVFAGAMTFGCVAWAKPLTARRRRRKKWSHIPVYCIFCVILSSIDICLAFIFSISGRSTASLFFFPYQGALLQLGFCYFHIRVRSCSLAFVISNSLAFLL